MLATVIDPATIGSPGAFLSGHLAVKFDHEDRPDFFIRANFERQPIEPGCRVRWLNVKDVVRIGVHDPRHLMQAQDLARALHAKHFSDVTGWKPADDLPGVLDQIDNMTAGLTKTEKLKHLEKRMRDLTDFIRSEIPSEKPRPEEIVDVAIRVMRRQEQALSSMCKLLRSDGPRSMIALDAWLAEYDPQQPVTFKRGDLVTWGAGQIHGRIVGPAPTVQAPWEVIITVGGSKHQLGNFITPELASLRHVKDD